MLTHLAGMYLGVPRRACEEQLLAFQGRRFCSSDRDAMARPGPGNLGPANLGMAQQENLGMETYWHDMARNVWIGGQTMLFV